MSRRSRLRKTMRSPARHARQWHSRWQRQLRRQLDDALQAVTEWWRDDSDGGPVWRQLDDPDTGTIELPACEPGSAARADGPGPWANWWLQQEAARVAFMAAHVTDVREVSRWLQAGCPMFDCVPTTPEWIVAA